jgi:glutaredoxin
MPQVVVYRQASCASCSHVERYLRDRGVVFTTKDIDADPAAMEKFLTYGYLTTPVTVIDGTPVPGFQLKRLAGLLATSDSDPEHSR